MKWLSLLGCAALIVFSLAETIVYSAQVCTGIAAPCFFWGPANGGVDPGPYPGYCCSQGANQVPALASCQPGMFTNNYDNPLVNQCGDLKSESYDPVMQVYTCGAVVTAQGCGGTGGIGGGARCKKQAC